MPRPRDPNRDRAFEIFRESNGAIDLVEIASQLNLSPGTIRGWKSKDDWEGRLNGTLRKNTERSKRKKGAQPGNQNAVGNRGGAAPKGNKNAVTTGEFETLLFDCLDPDEHRLVQAMPADKEQLLLQEIQLLTVRERRMLKRIDNLRKCEEAPDRAGAYKLEVPAGMTVVKYKAGIEKGKITDLGEYAGNLGQIQSIEDALTRVQARKQRAIETLHKFGYDDTRLELDAKLLALKMGTADEDDDQDDGFLEALTDTAKEDWSDEASEI